MYDHIAKGPEYDFAQNASGLPAADRYTTHTGRQGKQGDAVWGIFTCHSVYYDDYISCGRFSWVKL